MPAKRKYDTAGERQAAYRMRRRAAYHELLAAKGIPPMPKTPTMPGHRRWETMLQMASQLAQTAHSEMQDYFDLRSESWQESDKAEAFTERMDELADLIGLFESLDISRQNKKENTNAS